MIVYIKLLFKKGWEEMGLLASISMLFWCCHLIVQELPDKLLVILMSLQFNVYQVRINIAQNDGNIAERGHERVAYR